MPKLVKTTSSYLIFLDDDGEVDFGPSSVFDDDEAAQPKHLDGKRKSKPKRQPLIKYGIDQSLGLEL